ncbi:MAG: hypothetical protein LBC96_08135 [Lachnospiraceae bacterium]|jgi:hypothetical protein|nr:hypothetical protein [Lachnospiraceae bacterium]
MKKTIAKGFLLLIIFGISIYLISDYMNQGNVDMTAQMGPATFPLVYVTRGERRLNTMRGYIEPMETSSLRESLTPLAPGRSLSFHIDKFGNTIHQLSFEVRSIDGSRLIESTEITEYTEDGDTIKIDLSIKDLIDPAQEYTFILLAETAFDRTIRFYTRIYSVGDTNTEEKINFCFQFHEKSFNKDEARELTMYLEPNALGDNSTFNRVTINSSFHQVTWGNLNVTRITEPVLYIKEMATETGSFRVKYDVILDDNYDTRYTVEEFYRLRQGTERIFLLDFERTMEQVFAGVPQAIVNNRIQLGIVNPNVPLEESDGGNTFAFSVKNSLFGVILPDQKFIRLFDFADGENYDARTAYNGHRVRILNIDEAGNVAFMVYGYHNRGRHEGRAGIVVYYYNSIVNTTEELAHIPYYKSPQLLIAEVEQMLYLNRNNRLYLMISNEIHAIDLENRSLETIITGKQEGSYHISDSNRMLVWQNSEDVYAATSLTLMNLQDEQTTVIRAGFDEFIMPLGFMGEDLIYGLAKIGNVNLDMMGNMVFPMHSIIIQSANGEILKDHRQAGFFVSGISMSGNQITLRRLIRDEDGNFRETMATHITNQIVPTGTHNRVETAITESHGRIVRIAIRREVDPELMMMLTPREVLFEGSRGVEITDLGQDAARYYVYGKDGIQGIFLAAGDALTTAFPIAGVVVNQRGEYIWYRGNLRPRHQISNIEVATANEHESSLAISLDAILRHEGITVSTSHLLLRGESAVSSLERLLPEVDILDLTGVPIDTILYFVNRDIPVLAMLEDGNAVLVIGFNELNFILMNPMRGEIHRIGRQDATNWFEENGNRFFTYVRTYR